MKQYASLFRYHRGSLEDSMNTVIKITGLATDLLATVQKEYKDNMLEVPTVLSTSYAGFDERNKWDTYAVVAEYAGDKRIVGFANGKLLFPVTKDNSIIRRLDTRLRLARISIRIHNLYTADGIELADLKGYFYEQMQDNAIEEFANWSIDPTDQYLEQWLDKQNDLYYEALDNASRQ